jgi:hypothetical protein
VSIPLCETVGVGVGVYRGSRVLVGVGVFDDVMVIVGVVVGV